MNLPALRIPNDKWFDDQLPAYVRERSRQYWTPVAVAARAAAILHERGVKRVLDVGCGPGKFCVVGACMRPDLEFCGIEQRSRLVRVGRRLARSFGASNVRLLVGNATEVPWEPYDGFYFFNPFAENTYEKAERFDDGAQLSRVHFGAELLRVETLLERARAGAVVITYHGLGGPIPGSYELVGDERSGSDRIRTWVQGPPRQLRWVWLETLGGVTRVSRSDIYSTLTSLMCEHVN
jgi:SAM-dependent methyltransferase